MKNFIRFPKQFFLQNDFIDTKKAVLTGRPKFSGSFTGNDRKKFHKKCKNFSKLFSSKCSYGEVESSLKAPLTFFRQPAELFPLDIQKITNCMSSKRFSSESFYWNWESSFDTSVTFFSGIAQKFCSVSKKEKNLETKPFLVKMLPWTRRMQLQHSRRKTREEAENFLLNVWKWWKISIVFQNSFSFKMIL